MNNLLQTAAKFCLKMYKNYRDRNMELKNYFIETVQLPVFWISIWNIKISQKHTALQRRCKTLPKFMFIID